jgi:hypothetical protein
MPEQEVKYTLTLNDLLTGKVKEADHATQSLEGTLHRAGERVAGFGKELVGALGVGFAIFKGVEFIHEGVEAMHQVEQAEAQVRAGLESTRGAAGLAFEELEEGAKGLSKQFKFSRAEILDMQAQLLTFPSVTKETFGEASQSILDMSTRLHKGLNETAIMVGKALQDPAKGITALRRVGVNFNQTQTEAIKKMAETGHMAQAQKAILSELQTEFAGSAKAAANADPLFKFNKLMGSIKMGVGELAMELLSKLTPALEWIAEAFKTTFEWCKQNADIFKALAIGVGVASAAYVAYRGVLLVGVVASAVSTAWTYVQIAAMYTLKGAYEGASIGGKLLAAAQYALNAAWKASPVGVILTILAAVTAAVIYCYNHFATFRGFVWGLWAAIKEFVSLVIDRFTALGHVIHGVMNFNWSEIKQGLSDGIKTFTDAGQRLGEAYKKGFAGGMADFAKDHINENSPHTITKKGPAIMGATGADGKSATAKATGNKSTNIHVTINGGLVHELTYQVKNIQESTSKLKEIVVQTLLSAVNDSQIIAGE